MLQGWVGVGVPDGARHVGNINVIGCNVYEYDIL